MKGLDNSLLECTRHNSTEDGFVYNPGYRLFQRTSTKFKNVMMMMMIIIITTTTTMKMIRFVVCVNVLLPLSQMVLYLPYIPHFVSNLLFNLFIVTLWPYQRSECQ